MKKRTFFRTKQVQKHTPSYRRLVKTLASGRTQNFEQPKKFFQPDSKILYNPD